MWFSYKGEEKGEREGEKGKGKWAQGKERNTGINHEAFAKSVITWYIKKPLNSLSRT